ncbi:tape measure protein [Shewanella sp. SM73]|uniref:tape measure protein n=1 Tax=Shewanella sp. SM73 TaxID=2912806 RepID=UPI0021DB2AEB|nr:tape measure protein [Shewanella sp. SM73]MCU8031773.1 tape measure protein [Shewanella sp. SM73]
MNDLKLALTLTADGRQLVTVVGGAKKELIGLTGELQATGTAGKTAAIGLDTTAKSADVAQHNFAGLYQSAIALAGGLTAMAVIDRADEWGQMASRMKMATTSVADYEYAQSRMVASANQTYRSLTETRENFTRMSPILRDLGYNLTQSIDIVDSYSALLVTNAASADKAQQAQDALSQSIQKGKVEADAWQSIFGVMPSILNNLSAATGKTGAEIRLLGTSGKLSITDLTNALLQSHQQNLKAVEDMPTAVRDALTALDNVYSDWIGNSNEALGATATLASGIVVLSENFDTLVDIVGVGLAVALGRGTAALGTHATSLIANEVASYRTRAASVAAAQAELQRATMLRASVISAGQAIVAEARLTAARQALTVATGTATLATRTLNAALSLAGGPAGLVMMGAAALAYWAMTADNATQPTDDLSSKVDSLVGSYQKLTDLERQSKVRVLGTEMKVLRDELIATTAEIERLNREPAYDAFNGSYLRDDGQIAQLKARIEELNKQLDLASKKQQALFAVGMPEIKADPTIVDPNLTKTAAEMLINLQKQLTLYGQTTEAAKLRYELEIGALKGLDPLMAEKLKKVAADLDAAKAAEEQTKKNKEAEKQRQEQLKTLLGAIDPVTQAAKEYAKHEALLKTYFESTNAPIAERTRLLGLLKNQYEESTPYSQLQNQLDPKHAEQQTHTNNLDVLNTELNDTPESEALKRNQINALIEAEQRRHAEAMKDINKSVSFDWDEMWQNSVERMSQGIGSATADALFEAKDFGDATAQVLKGVGKAAVQMLVEWMAQKALAAAFDNTLMTTNATTAATTAAGTGAAITASMAPAAATTSIATMGSGAMIGMAAMVAAMAMLPSIIGKFHGGGTIPREGTYLLDGGETIYTRRQQQTLMNAMQASANGGGAGRSVVVQQSNTIVVKNDTDAQTLEDVLPQLVRMTKEAVVDDLNNRGEVFRARG